jgi:hypothetical protein
MITDTLVHQKMESPKKASSASPPPPPPTTTTTTATSSSNEEAAVVGTKRKVTPEQDTAIKKRPNVVFIPSYDVTKYVVPNDNNNTSSSLKVCKVMVQNLRGGKGDANTDYMVNLLIGKHGLFDLVCKVFEIMKESKLTRDNCGSHLWSVVFHGTKYDNGWRTSLDGYCPGGPMRHVDEHDVRPLKDLKIQVGQKGTWSGESGSFHFVVTEIDGTPEAGVEYPQHSAIKLTCSSALTDDWITASQKAACIQAREAWVAYYKGSSNSSKRDRSTGQVVPCKPLVSPWGSEEFELLGLCLNAGHAFTKSWKLILQYALVTRPQAASSQQWYKLQKEDYRREYVGKGKSAAQMTMLVKKLALNMVTNLPLPPSPAAILEQRNQMVMRRENMLRGMDFSDGDDFY